jgi:predicted DsbA family dithiol-disulfide isomerase
LVSIAVEAGIEGSPAEEFLASDKGSDEVLSDERRFKAMGIGGVPSFIVNGVVLFSGAAEPEMLAQAFREA